jgi:hypothetical protein
MTKQVRGVSLGAVVVVVGLLSGCGVEGIATPIAVEGGGESAAGPIEVERYELRGGWKKGLGRDLKARETTTMPVDDGTVTPPTTEQDAGTPTPVIEDAGVTEPPTPPTPEDAGTTAPPPPPPAVDAGTTTPPPPPPAVDAGTTTPPPPPPAVDAGTTTPPPPPPAVDAGTTAPPPTVDAGTLLPPGSAGPADVTFAVNSGASRKPISRYIYGKNFNGSTWANEPNLTTNRLGGNRWTAFNWENNASNAGSDYNHQSDSYLGGGNTPGEAVRSHVANAQAAGGAMLVTVPILGWVAADKAGTSVYGQTIASRFFRTEATKGSAFQYPPNLTDNVVYQDEFVWWLERTFPAAHDDPARDIFYSLDNEPDLWNDTHPVIHPSALTYSELISKSITTAAAVKAVAPRGKVFGFVSYGFNGFVSLQDAPDAAGRDFTDHFLRSMRDAEATYGKRLVDVLDLHWYPEAKGGGVRIIGEDTSAAVAAARVQAPRSLWDPTYVESSWIASYTGSQGIQLIPSMKRKIAANYPGTELAFTEYYYGGGSHISGGVAQADVLGIFGREGVFAAHLWPMSSNTPYIKAAFAMFRSYDGNGGSFGDLSVQASTTDVAGTSVYASVDSSNPNRMVLVVINKADTAKTAALSVTHTTAFSRARVYQLTSASSTPTRGIDVLPTSTNAFRYTMPAMSVSTLVLEP